MFEVFFFTFFLSNSHVISLLLERMLLKKLHLVSISTCIDGLLLHDPLLFGRYLGLSRLLLLDSLSEGYLRLILFCRLMARIGQGWYWHHSLRKN